MNACKNALQCSTLIFIVVFFWGCENGIVGVHHPEIFEDPPRYYFVAGDTATAEGLVGFFEVSNPPGSHTPFSASFTLNDVRWLSHPPQNAPSWIYIEGSVTQSDANSAKRVLVSGLLDTTTTPLGKNLRMKILELQYIS